MEKTIVSSIEEWKSITKEILSSFNTPKDTAVVLVLSGELGVGKTSFVKALAEALSIEEVITSPTFNIFKNYTTSHPQFSNLVHMDAYRLESESELEPLRFNDLLKDSKNIICIEWGEKIKNVLPDTTIYFQLEINENNQHTIQRVS